MIGSVTLKKINKVTGETSIIFKKNNQTTTGFGHTIVNVLTGQGSRNLEDYQIGYFQLGDQQYDLTDFGNLGMSADCGVSANVPYFWTLKSKLVASAYGTDSVLSVEKQKQYGLGSYVPSGAPTTTLFDNFVQPPETTNTIYDYADRFYLPGRGQPALVPNGSGIFVAGCANAWEGTEGRNSYKDYPLYSSASYDLSGPDNQVPTFKIFYNDNEKPPGSSCLRPGTGYVYSDGSMPAVWNYARKEQTQSWFVAPIYYASSLSTSGSTTLTGRNQIFNRTGQAYVKPSSGWNKSEFLFRFDYTDTNNATTYTPIIIEASSGYQNCLAGTDDCTQDLWEEVFGTEGGGDVSANIYNRFGAIHTFADVTGCAEGPYRCFTGPGGAYMNTPNAGFGPLGNYYKTTTSWYDVPSGVVDIINDGGSVLQAMLFPILSSLDTIDVSKDPSAGGVVGEKSHNKDPRPAAFVSNYQFEYVKDPTSKQQVNGEKSYYVSEDAYFVKIPRYYTTRLNDNTINVRILIDENLANGQEISEIGLFTKNPTGNRVVDNPFLIAYKSLDEPFLKSEDFSYIVDWELSLVDLDSD